MSWQSVDYPHVQVIRPSVEGSYGAFLPVPSRSPTAGERFAARFVILLLAACVGIALFDLYQLLAGIN
jgi:hypothetical protein